MSSLSEKVDPKFVSKAFLVKFGNCYIRPNASIEKLDVKPLINKIKDCLNASPSVKSVETKAVPPAEDFISTSRRQPGKPEKIEAIEFTPLIEASVTLPVKNQRIAALYSSLFGKGNVDATADSGVLYNGSIYAIFRVIDFSKNIHDGAPDIRNLFVGLLEKESSWEVRKVPPNPLRQDIYFVYLFEKEETRKYLGKVFAEKGEVYFHLPESESAHFEELLGRLLVMPRTLGDFYHASDLKHQIEDVAEDLNETHKSIQKVIAGFLKLRFIDVYNHYKHSRELEKLVSRHYSLLLDYSGKTQMLRQCTKDVEDLMSDDYVLKHFKNQLMEDLVFEAIDVETLTKCASYACEVVQRSYTTKITLLGVLIGVLGTAIGTLILQFILP
jgi:hypothetical protein